MLWMLGMHIKNYSKWNLQWRKSTLIPEQNKAQKGTFDKKDTKIWKILWI